MFSPMGSRWHAPDIIEAEILVGYYQVWHPVTGQCTYMVVRFVDYKGSGKHPLQVVPKTHVHEGQTLYLSRWTYDDDRYRYKEDAEIAVMIPRPVEIGKKWWHSVDPAIHGNPLERIDK